MRATIKITTGQRLPVNRTNVILINFLYVCDNFCSIDVLYPSILRLTNEQDTVRDKRSEINLHLLPFHKEKNVGILEDK